MRPASRAFVTLAAAGVALAAEQGLRRVAATHPRWTRHNYRDRTVVLSGGPGAVAGALVATGCLASAPGALAVGASGAALGLYDDLYGDSHARGLVGHLRALRDGRLTTGMVKLVGMAGVGLLAGMTQRRRVAPALIDATLIAGAANLVNLLDLRPGRALKVVTVAAAASMAMSGSAGAVAAATTGAASAMLPADLAEQVMIGDCGANGLGALVGWCLATGLGSRGRAVAVTAVVGMTLASERVSFTSVIERTAWLDAIDRLGRT